MCFNTGMKRMRKVLHIITRLDMGGSAQNTLLTCSRLAETHDIALAHGLSLESEMTDWEQRTLALQKAEASGRGVRFFAVKALVRRIDPARDLRALAALTSLIRKERPVLVHTHSSKAGILGRLAARLNAVPIVAHTPHGHVFYGHFAPAVSKLFLLMERVFNTITDCLVALTEGERQDYITLSVSKPEKIHTIHSGVDVDRFRPDRTNDAASRKFLGVSGKALIVGTIGWLLPVKNPEILLKAMLPIWKKEIDAFLVYVGKGELRAKLETEAAALGVADRVRFLGWRSDVASVVQLFDVFALPSLNEGMGRVLVEAMAAAKPIVASNVAGIPDLVRHGYNGFLAHPTNVQEFSLFIETLLKDGGLRAEMGKRGLELAPNFSIENMVRKTEVLYFSLFRQMRI